MEALGCTPRGCSRVANRKWRWRRRWGSPGSVPTTGSTRGRPKDGRGSKARAARVGSRDWTPRSWPGVERALRNGPRARGFSTDLWTLPRVAELIARLTRVRHHPGHVWRLLRGLGWSLQRPTRRARERDEPAIKTWKTRRWRQLKNTPGADGPGSSSRTTAASRSSPSSAERGRRGGNARPDTCRRQLEAPVGGRRVGLPMGWAPDPVLLSNSAGQLHRSHLDRLPAGPPASLPATAGHPDLGRAASS